MHCRSVSINYTFQRIPDRRGEDMDHYRIELEGILDKRWINWYQSMIINHLETGVTVVSGPIQDQSALHGILNRIRDMNLTILKVERTETIESKGDT